MNINTVFTVLYQVIKGTPFYVWILLAYLISKGLNATKVKPLSLSKMLIMPAIFVTWGLEKMFLNFANLGLDLSLYIVVAAIGTSTGYFLYNKSRKVFYENDTFYRTGSYLPLAIILISFSIKYLLNVLIAVSPLLYASTKFCFLYSALSGFSVGLFFGGWLQAYTAYKKCCLNTPVTS